MSAQTLPIPTLGLGEKYQVIELLWAAAGYCLRGAEGDELKPGLRLIRRFTRGLLQGAGNIDVSDLSPAELWAGAGLITAALAEMAGRKIAYRWERNFFRLMAQVERNGDSGQRD
jgi:hypothetical protein